MKLKLKKKHNLQYELKLKKQQSSFMFICRYFKKFQVLHRFYAIESLRKYSRKLNFY